jgi:hypothetical protein
MIVSKNATTQEPVGKRGGLIARIDNHLVEFAVAWLSMGKSIVSIQFPEEGNLKEIRISKKNIVQFTPCGN